MKKLQGHRRRVNDIAFSPDGALLVSCGNDCTVRLWDTQSGQGEVLFQVEKGEFTEFTKVAFTADGRHVLARSSRHGLQLWDVAQRLLRTTLIPHEGAIYRGGMAVAPTGNRVAANQWLPRPVPTDLILVWDSVTWESSVVYRTPGSWNFRGLTFDPTGTRLATIIGIFDVEARARVLKGSFPEGGLRWSPGQPLLAGASHGSSTLQVIDAGTGNQVKLLHLEKKHVQDFAFSPDGCYLAVVSNEEIVRVWDTRTWKEREGLAWGIGKLKCLAFAPDGQRAACAGERGAILLWDWDL